MTLKPIPRIPNWGLDNHQVRSRNEALYGRPSIRLSYCSCTELTATAIQDHLLKVGVLFCRTYQSTQQVCKLGPDPMLVYGGSLGGPKQFIGWEGMQNLIKQIVQETPLEAIRGLYRNVGSMRISWEGILPLGAPSWDIAMKELVPYLETQNLPWILAQLTNHQASLVAAAVRQHESNKDCI